MSPKSDAKLWTTEHIKLRQMKCARNKMFYDPVVEIL